MTKDNIKKRAKRIRAKIEGTKEKPRLSVYRSNTFIYGQIIDDKAGKTILGISEKNLEDKKGTKLERARKLGLLVSKKALEQKIKKVIFDKGPYAYHGRVKSFAEGAREGGLEF